LRANATHGLPRSSADKRRAILRAFAGEEWQTWTDRAIADLCGVVAKTVAAVRAELIVSGDLAPSAERTVVRRGKVYQIQTERIRAANVSRRRAEPEDDWNGDEDEDEDVGEDLPETEAEETDPATAGAYADAVAGDTDVSIVSMAIGQGDAGLWSALGDATDDASATVEAGAEVGAKEVEDVTEQIAPLLRADLWQPFAQQVWRIVAAPALHPALHAAAVTAQPTAPLGITGTTGTMGTTGAPPRGYWAVAPTGAARVPYAQPAATPAELERALWTVWEAEKAFEKGGDLGRRPWPLTRAVAHPALTPDLRARGCTLYERKNAWWMQTRGAPLRAWRDRTTPNVPSAERAVADARALERLERLGWTLQGNTREGWWARKGFWSLGQPRPDEQTARCATWAEVAEAAVTLARAGADPATPTTRHTPLAPMVLWAPEQTAAYTLPPLTRFAVRYHTVRDGLVTTVRCQRLPDTSSVAGGEPGDSAESGTALASAGQTQPETPPDAARSLPPGDVWLLRDEDVWVEAQRRYARFQQALTALADALDATGAYAQRLADAGGLKLAPNPLSPTVIAALDPHPTLPRTFWLGRWKTPQPTRLAVARHTAQMLFVGDGPHTRSFKQADHFVCPSDAVWEHLTQLAVAAQEAERAWWAFLREAQTYLATFQAQRAVSATPGDQGEHTEHGDEATALHGAAALVGVVGTDQHPPTVSAVPSATNLPHTGVLTAAPFTVTAPTGADVGQVTLQGTPETPVASVQLTTGVPDDAPDDAERGAAAVTGADATATFERMVAALTDRLTQLAQGDPGLVAVVTVVAVLLGGNEALEEVRETPTSLPYSVAMLLMVEGWETLDPEGQAQIAVALGCAASGHAELHEAPQS